MAGDTYIWIPNWFGRDDDKGEGFQHYRDRDPIWIKNYTRLLSHDAYADLSYHHRGILHGTWLEYARASRRLRGDTVTLTRRLGQRVTRRDLEVLNHAGFIELIASDVLAARLQQASPHARPRGREKEVLRTSSKRAIESRNNSSDSIAQEKKIPRVCPECGTGGGLHVIDCPTVIGISR